MDDYRDPLFKGCTRPAMLFGVPLVPLCLVGCSIILLSIYTTLLLLTMLIPVILVMRFIVKEDDQKFRLIGKKIIFRVNNTNGRFWKSSAYSPLEFRKRK